MQKNCKSCVAKINKEKQLEIKKRKKNAIKFF